MSPISTQMLLEDVGESRVDDDRVQRKHNDVVDQDRHVDARRRQGHRKWKGEEEERDEGDREDDDESVNRLGIFVIEYVAAR